VSAEFAFCPKCGSALPSPAVTQGDSQTVLAQAVRRLVPREYAERLLATRGAAPSERRTVTILFSDIKGYTAMAEKLDPEDVVEIMDGAFEFLIGPIYRYEGTLAELMGDAILAFFGAPIAHEDDPERACRAALEIIAGAKEYAQRLERERGIYGFNVRVGINTGLVVVGEVGSDLRVAYTAVGDAINLAARMEQAAEPGTVLITENTHKLIAPLFETQVLGPTQVKGKTAPVHVYRVLAPRPAAGKPRGLPGLQSPLVGRESEFAALLEATEHLRAGVGGIVSIVGEAGLGKSRLAAELHTAAAALHWVEGRCLSYGTSVAYLLWLDILRHLLGLSDEAAPLEMLEAAQQRISALCPRRYSDVYPFVARIMSLPLEPDQEATLRALPGEEIKSGSFRAVAALLESTANQGPLVLVCEDLHWADPTSVELLEQVLPLTDRAPILLICLFRPDRDCPCWRIKETAARLYPHRHTDLTLRPLSASDGEVLLANLLQTSDAPAHRVEGIPAQLRERILRATEGNPFYVEEVLRSLIDRGAIRRDEAGCWTVQSDVVDIHIPETLLGVLVARMDRLREDTRRVLQLASVIGRTFLYRVLSAIAQEERELDAHLVTLQRQEMIRERARIPELEYIFKHELTREAAYGGLLKKERQAFHRQVAEALERLFPDRIDEQVELLAHHWQQAGINDKAITYLLRAAKRARGNYACREAIHHHTLALELAQQSSSPDKDALVASILERRGEAYSAIGDMGAARGDLYQVLEWARKTGDRRRQAELELDLQGPLLTGHELDEAMALAQDAYSIAADLHDDLLIARSTGALGGGLSMKGEVDKAHGYLQAAVAASRTLGAAASLSEALSSFMMERYWVADFRGALAASDEALALAEQARNPQWSYSALLGVSLAQCSLGNYDQALHALHQAKELVQRAQMPNAQAELPNYEGWVYQEIYDLDRSMRLNSEGAEAAHQRGEIESEANALVNLGVDHLWLHDLRAAQQRFEEAWALLDKQFAGYRWRWKTRLLAAWGELSLAQGDAFHALEYADQSLQLAQATSARKNLVKGWIVKGQTLVALDRVEEAVALLNGAAALADEIGNPPLRWKSHFALGQVLARQGQRSEGERQITLAAAVVEDIASGLSDRILRSTFLAAPPVRAVLTARD
jgi:predicted ATPase/class 3 adenylate cyclase